MLNSPYHKYVNHRSSPFITYAITSIVRAMGTVKDDEDLSHLFGGPERFAALVSGPYIL